MNRQEDENCPWNENFEKQYEDPDSPFFIEDDDFLEDGSCQDEMSPDPLKDWDYDENNDPYDEMWNEDMEEEINNRLRQDLDKTKDSLKNK